MVQWVLLAAACATVQTVRLAPACPDRPASLMIAAAPEVGCNPAQPGTADLDDPFAALAPPLAQIPVPARFQGTARTWALRLASRGRLIVLFAPKTSPPVVACS